MPTVSSVEKAVNRLKEAVRDGQAYEGLQTIKSLHRRLRSKRQNDQARELLSRSSAELWHANETSASLDLAKALLQDCRDCREGGGGIDTVALQLEEVLAVMAMSPPQADDTATASALQDETCSWAETAANWAWRAEPAAAGSLRVLQLAGDVVLAARGPKLGGHAYVLYAQCNSVNSMQAALSNNLEAKGVDWGIHVTRAALLLLAYAPAMSSAQCDWPEQIAPATRLRTAEYLVKQCQQEQLHAPRFRGIPKDNTCLFSFCELLVQVLAMHSTQKPLAQHLGATLSQHYMPALSRDKELAELLEKVFEVYQLFPRRQVTGGMLSGLMSMLSSQH